MAMRIINLRLTDEAIAEIDKIVAESNGEFTSRTHYIRAIVLRSLK